MNVRSDAESYRDLTTLRGADAALKAIKSLQSSEVQVRALQEYHS